MKVQTSNLTGPALDWAVATLQKLPIRKDPMGFGRQPPGGYWIWADGFPPSVPYMQIGKAYSPSTNWSLAGPIIEREGINLFTNAAGRTGGDTWAAEMDNNGEDAFSCDGPTPLIAAMRCLVASKLGTELEVPGELLEICNA